MIYHHYFFSEWDLEKENNDTNLEYVILNGIENCFVA